MTQKENKVKCSAYGNVPQECELYPDCDDCSGNITKLDMRQEDFIEAAYNNDRESSKQEQQFFVEGCKYGYQYAVEKVCDILNHYCNRSGVHPSIRVDIINHICKAMEE